MARSGQAMDPRQQTSPIPILQASTTAHLLTKPQLSRSPSDFIIDDYINTKAASPSSTATLKRTESTSPVLKPRLDTDLPHKFRPFSDYELCDKELLKKLKIEMPEKSAHTFNLYIKKKDRQKENPAIYFIKTGDANSYNHEFEAFHAALFNLLVPGIIPSPHVIYDDTKPDKPPIGICTRFDTSFIPVKKKPVAEEDLKDPEVIKCLAEIITLAYILEDDDLHAHNFGWAKHRRLMRVDAGMALWNYIRLHPKLSSFLAPWLWRTKSDRFPVITSDIDKGPNYENAKPYYSPTGDYFLSGPSSDTWLAFLRSKNEFKSTDAAVYKKPENLQYNADYEYHKFKLHLKSIFLSNTTVKDYASLFLRKKEGETELKHIDEYTTHIINRLNQFKAALLQSDEFKKFIKNDGVRAMHDIFKEVEESQQAIDTKSKKPNAARAYHGLFSALKADSVKSDWRKLQEEIHKPDLSK